MPKKALAFGTQSTTSESLLSSTTSQPSTKSNAPLSVQPRDPSKALKELKDAVENVIRRSRGVSPRLYFWPHGIEVRKGRAKANVPTFHHGSGNAIAEGNPASTQFWSVVRQQISPDSVVVEGRLPNGTPIVNFDRIAPPPRAEPTWSARNSHRSLSRGECHTSPRPLMRVRGGSA